MNSKKGSIRLHQLLSVAPRPWHLGASLGRFCDWHVFVNIPYDNAYRNLERALCFTLMAYGFQPVMAKSSRKDIVRLDKIVTLMKACKYGVSDVSRGLRHNMPYEHGMLQVLPNIKARCVLTTDRFKAKRRMSDIDGFDAIAHNNRPATLVQKLSEWLLDNTFEDIPPLRREIRPEHILRALTKTIIHVSDLGDYFRLNQELDGLLVQAAISM